jgi:hypothetical protein
VGKQLHGTAHPQLCLKLLGSCLEAFKGLAQTLRVPGSQPGMYGWVTTTRSLGDVLQMRTLPSSGNFAGPNIRVATPAMTAICIGLTASQWSSKVLFVR